MKLLNRSVYSFSKGLLKDDPAPCFSLDPQSLRENLVELAYMDRFSRVSIRLYLHCGIHARIIHVYYMTYCVYMYTHMSHITLSMYVYISVCEYMFGPLGHRPPKSRSEFGPDYLAIACSLPSNDPETL